MRQFLLLRKRLGGCVTFSFCCCWCCCCCCIVVKADENGRPVDAFIPHLYEFLIIVHSYVLNLQDRLALPHFFLKFLFKPLSFSLSLFQCFLASRCLLSFRLHRKSPIIYLYVFIIYLFYVSFRRAKGDEELIRVHHRWRHCAVRCSIHKYKGNSSRIWSIQVIVAIQ